MASVDEPLVQRLAREIQEVLDDSPLSAPEAHGYAFPAARAVLPLVAAEVEAAASKDRELVRFWRDQAQHWKARAEAEVRDLRKQIHYCSGSCRIPASVGRTEPEGN